jgi:DNA (cytosine-5)-methyltransferase 1
VKQNRKRPIGVDLFAGAGGMSLGFEQAGFEVAAAVEYDPVHSATHEFNFPNCAAVCRSVADIDGQYIRKNSHIGNRKVDVVFGGGPCQGFSLIGKRAVDDPRNSLIRHFVRLVLDLKASYFVFENVRGLTVGAHGKFLEEVIGEFQKGGYRVLENYRVLNAARYGVPQDRQRLFLIGARKGNRLPEYPTETHEPPNGKSDAASGATLKSTPTVWDALTDLPEADEFDELLERDWVKAKFRKASDYSAALRGDTEDPADYSAGREYDGTILTSSLRTVHTADAKRRFRETEQGETEAVSRYFKLDPDGLCNTIRAGTASDHGAFSSPRPIHPNSARCITVREAARLHSYPDWFRFHVTKWHGFRQIGNSVPPLLARAVASKVIAAFSEPIKSECHPVSTETQLLAMGMRAAAARYEVPANVIAPRTRPAR